jgi:hypothetical protein
MKGFSKSSSVTPQAFNSARWGARSKPFFMASLRIVTLPHPSWNVTARPKTFFFSYRTPSAVFRGPYMGLVNMLGENLRIALSDLKKVILVCHPRERKTSMVIVAEKANLEAIRGVA